MLFVRPLAVIAHDPIRINKYWRYAARSPAHCALKTELSAFPHHSGKSMSSITRKGCREPGRISAPGDSRVQEARQSGTPARRQVCTRLAAIRMDLSSVLELWSPLAVLRDSNKKITAWRSRFRSRITSHRESTGPPF